MVPKTSEERQGARAMADDVASKPKRGPGQAEKRGRREKRARGKASATRQNNTSKARTSEEVSRGAQTRARRDSEAKTTGRVASKECMRRQWRTEAKTREVILNALRSQRTKDRGSSQRPFSKTQGAEGGRRRDHGDLLRPSALAKPCGVRTIMADKASPSVSVP